MKLKHEVTTDESLAEAITTLAAAFNRLTDTLDRITQLAEDMADAVDLPMSDRKETVREESVG